jgi:hypothetical protein
MDERGRGREENGLRGAAHGEHVIAVPARAPRPWVGRIKLEGAIDEELVSINAGRQIQVNREGALSARRALARFGIEIDGSPPISHFSGDLDERLPAGSFVDRERERARRRTRRAKPERAPIPAETSAHAILRMFRLSTRGQ